MKTTEFTVAGSTWHLCLNGAALFDIYDKYGDKGSLLDHIKGNDKAAFQATCWILAKLAEQGELVRRYHGFDHGLFPTALMFQTMLKPLEVAEAKRVITMAVSQGFARDEPDEEASIDLGLVELQKKRDRADPIPLSADNDTVFEPVRPRGDAPDGRTGQRPDQAGEDPSWDQGWGW